MEFLSQELRAFIAKDFHIIFERADKECDEEVFKGMAELGWLPAMVQWRNMMHEWSWATFDTWLLKQ